MSFYLTGKQNTHYVIYMRDLQQRNVTPGESGRKHPPEVTQKWCQDNCNHGPSDCPVGLCGHKYGSSSVPTPNVNHGGGSTPSDYRFS